MVISMVGFHVLMLLLSLAIASRVVSTQRVSNLLGYLHNMIGITIPAAEQVRTVAIIWIASTVVIVDGCLLLLVILTSLTSAARSGG